MNMLCQSQGAKLTAEDAAKKLIKLNIQLAELIRSHFYYDSLCLFQQIHSSPCITPDHYSLSTSITASTRLRSFTFGSQLHCHGVRTGLSAFNPVSNSLLSFYAKSENLGNVKLVFCEMGYPDSYSWTTLMSACTKLGQISHACQLLHVMPVRKTEPWNAVMTACVEDGRHAFAFDLFRRMQLLGVRHDNYTFACVLSLCSVGFYEFGRQIQSSVFKSGFSGYTSVVNSLISMFFNCGSASDAYEVFEGTNETVHNEITYKAMINGLLKVKRNEEALVLFKEMLTKGLRPTALSFVSLMSSGLDLITCVQLHGHVIEMGYESYTAVSNATMAMYTDNGYLGPARNIFVNLEKKDVISWNTLIAGYAQNQFANFAIFGFVEMLRCGIKPDEYTVGALITNVDTLEHSQMFYAYVLKSGIIQLTEVVNALVSSFMSQGDVGSAYAEFSGMPYKNLISWNAIISGFLQNGYPLQALNLFLQMQKTKTKPDLYTLTTILSICSNSSALEQGKQVHAYIIIHWPFQEPSLGNGLITMYAQCGCLDWSSRVFDCMNIRNVVSWNAIISSFAHYGEGTKALQFFRAMQSEVWIRPDQATFTVVLSACSHAGLVCEGIHIFNLMVNEYGLEPKVSQFSCLIDLLARAGYLDETEKLVQTKVFDVDAIVLWSLFSACVAYGNVRLGRIVAGLLLQTEKSDPSIYVLLSNIHANAGQWEDAAHVRELIRKLGL